MRLCIFAPMQKKRVFLLGPPATGKSTCGKKLAQVLGWQFLDTDTLIEAQTQQSIPALFAEYGEKHFREAERHALEHCFELEKIVVATGGGLPVWYDNLAQMQAHGLTLYLQTSTKELLRRAKADPIPRPLLAGENAAEKLEALLAQRLPTYEKAQLHFPSLTPVEEIAEAVRLFLDGHL